jgi:nucleoid-associated protein YgaU
LERVLSSQKRLPQHPSLLKSLVISPVGASPKLAKKVTATPISPEELKDLKLENYTIRQGDSLVKVIRSRYEISDEKLYREYLELVRGLNPSIEDLDTVNPGQVVRLPIWTPQVVRAPIALH